MSQFDWKAIRAKFPACSRYTYLNAAGGSPMCAEASVEGKRYFDEMLLYGDTCWDDWLIRVEQVREKVACFLGALKDEIAFTPNTSTGMAVIAQLLKNRGKVVTMGDEFPSSTLPWLNLGYGVDFIEPQKGIYRLSEIEKAVRPDHKILVASYVQYKTGFRQNLSELGRFCRSAGLVFVVNATQAMGVFPVNVVLDNIDLLVFSGLKWTCAGYGASGVFISRHLTGNLQLPLSGWRSVKSPEKMDNRISNLRTDASAIEAGSPSFPAIFALGGALDLIDSIGIERCMDRVQYLNRQLEEKLHQYEIPVIFSFPDENRSGITMVKSNDAKILVHKLAEKGIIVSARGEGLRISVNFYNNEEDIDRLVDVLKNCKMLS
jgi:cysteine desulfurase/selenocysteine lyase